MGYASEGASSWKSGEGERFVGKIMPSEKELKVIRDKAKRDRKDPDAAKIEYLKKLDEANARLRETKGDEARQSAEKHLREKLK